MSNDDRGQFDRMEMAGRLIFGKPGRMTLGMFCAAMQGEDITCACYQDFCRRRHWPTLPSLKPDIDRFEKLGMVEQLHRQNSYSRWYRVRPHALWAVFSPVRLAEIVDFDLMASIGRAAEKVTQNTTPVESVRSQAMALARRFQP